MCLSALMDGHISIHSKWSENPLKFFNLFLANNISLSSLGKDGHISIHSKWFYDHSYFLELYPLSPRVRWNINAKANCFSRKPGKSPWQHWHRDKTTAWTTSQEIPYCLPCSSACLVIKLALWQINYNFSNERWIRQMLPQPNLKF